MNILILNYEYPPLGGGAGVVSRYHAEGLCKLSHNVTVLTAWYKGEKEEEQFANLKVIKLKSRRKYTYKSTPDEWLSWISKSKKFLASHLKENKIDYCFAHFALPGGVVAKYINKLFDIPYAIISHGQDIPWFFPKQMFKYHIFTYFWIKGICKKSDKLILLTDAMKKNADRFMRKHKYKNIVIPNGCESSNFYPDYKKRSDEFKIIFTGRLVAQKSPFIFLKALKILKKEIVSGFTVNVMGDGALLVRMKQFVKQNNLENEVKFNGWVNKEEMLLEYQSAHVQVMSSEAEAMSISALESLSSGLYLISTPVSGNTDIIEEGINGDFFDFGNYKMLSEQLVNYYNKKYRQKYKIEKAFLDDFRNKYDWEAITKQIEKRVLFEK